nr:UbiA family prenyltransferase [Arthrobacter roseus]
MSVPRRIVHISRPVLWINTIGTGVIGMWLAGDLWNWDALGVLLWLTLPFNLLIYGVNDVSDQDTDELNPRKGTFEGARIRSSEVRVIWAAVIAINLPFLIYFTVTLPSAALIWIALYALVFIGYSVPPLRFKARPFFDSLSNAAYALPLVIIPIALDVQPVWSAVLGLMAWSAAKHTFDAVQDIADDARAGITTTAVRLGARGVVLWSGAWWVVATVCFALINVPLAVINAVIAGWLLRELYKTPTPQKAHELYPYSIAFPYIAGTAAGIQLVVALQLGWYT